MSDPPLYGEALNAATESAVPIVFHSKSTYVLIITRVSLA